MGISLDDFEKMKQRMGKPSKRAAAPVFEPSSVPSAGKSHTTILGIDPSLRGTGFGVIVLAKPHPRVITHGTIHCPAGWERSRCLFQIASAIRDVVKKTKPTVCVIEGLFFAQNLQTALIMGEARGASLVAAAEFGLDIFEIAPRKVKQAIVGYGAAQKLAVSKMVQRLLQMPEPPSPDAADALALALTYARETNSYGLSQPKKV